jgi:hypothetical protein
MGKGPSRRFRRVLEANPPELAPVLTHLANVQRIARQVHQCLPPPWSERCRVANYKEGVLTIHVESATWASRLRYLLPEIKEKLSKIHGVRDVLEIQVRTHPSIRADNPTPRRAHLSKEAAGLLTSLADSISNPGLASALRRLAQNGAGPTMPATHKDAPVSGN